MNALAQHAAPVQWLYTVKATGTDRYGHRVAIADTSIDATSGAHAAALFRSKVTSKAWPGHRYTEVVVDHVEREVDSYGITQLRAQMQGEINRLTNQLEQLRTVEVPEIWITVNPSWDHDPQCNEDVRLTEDEAERVVAKFLETHEDELATLAQEMHA